MKKLRTITIFVLLFILQQQNTYCQKITFNPKQHKNAPLTFSFTFPNHSIQGIFAGDTLSSKPLLIFITGSGKNPLYTVINDSLYYPLFPKTIIQHENYNVLMLSKLNIPAIVERKRLSKDYSYLSYKGSEESYTLDFYTAYYRLLIDNLKKYIPYSKLIVMGHSEGARTVAELCNNNSIIDKFIYMSADPLGRIASVYNPNHLNGIQENIATNFLDSLLCDSNKKMTYLGDSFKTWKSFSKPSLPSLTNTNKKVLIVYGTHDTSCPNCYSFSFLPHFYKNITVLEYKGYNHNFFDLNSINNWNKVMKDVMKWIEK